MSKDVKNFTLDELVDFVYNELVSGPQMEKEKDIKSIGKEDILNVNTFVEIFRSNIREVSEYRAWVHFLINDERNYYQIGSGVYFNGILNETDQDFVINGLNVKLRNKFMGKKEKIDNAKYIYLIERDVRS